MTPEQTEAADRLLKAGKFADALALANDILTETPSDPGALYVAGQCFRNCEKRGLAYSFYTRYAAAHKDDPEVWNQLGACLQSESQVMDAKRMFERCIQLDPNNANALANLCAIAMQLSQPDEAIKWGERALAARPNWKDPLYNMGTAYLLKGEWGKGWDGFDYGLGSKERVKRPNYHESGPPDWDGSKGKTLIVYGEQGIGDEIMLSSMYPDAQRDAKRLIIECDKRLEGIFKRSFPGCDVYGTRYQQEVSWPFDYQLDARSAAASLGRFYRRKKEDFPRVPWLKADPERKTQWKALLDSMGPNKKVGIAWSGGGATTFAGRRTIGLERLLPILRVPNVDFVSLQYKDPSEDIERVKSQYGVEIRHWRRAAEASDYDEVAGLVDALDLVITVCTSVVHLCGALGKPCWVLVPDKPQWRYGMSGEAHDWYGSVRMFRQVAGVWPVEKVASELKQL